MKRYQIFMLAMVMICLMATTAVAKNTPVTIWNNTGKTIKHLFLDLSGQNYWNYDVLGPEEMNILKLETTYYIETEVDDSPTWDLRVEFIDGTVQEYYEISFRKSRGITLNRKGFSYD